LPLLPHFETSVAPPQRPVGSVPFAGTGVQVPSDAVSVHETHGPSQAALQQTFCPGSPAHVSPVWHWAVIVQGPPLGSRPHEPLRHVAVGAQRLAVPQVALQAAPPQVYGKQEVGAGVAQLPAPSHDDWAVNVVIPAGHVASLHFVPGMYFWQAPATQRPFVPQVVAPWSRQIPFGSRLPVGTFVQVPGVPGSAHDLQEALQVVEQQTPCAQTPEPQSTSAVHGAAIGFLPQELRVQTLGATQFAAAEQVSKHFVPLQA
jgi:hypothetical protein